MYSTTGAATTSAGAKYFTRSARRINLGELVACLTECGDLFHAMLWKCLCDALEDSKDVFERIDCSTNPQ